MFGQVTRRRDCPRCHHDWPHRDELRLLGDGIDLGIYGSRGQCAQRPFHEIGELGWMKGKTGQWPVLLLDEVLAELDPSAAPTCSHVYWNVNKLC